jgi:hypothetical protein
MGSRIFKISLQISLSEFAVYNGGKNYFVSALNI